jgi:DNA-binding transcriptional MerR regulator
MDKSPDAFRTISEVAEELDLPQHVLRFWETRFGQIRPLKRGGGRRYYRPDDVDLLKGIRHFLYGEGYTIRGVQRILKAEGVRFVQAIGRGEQSIATELAGAEPGSAADDGTELEEHAEAHRQPGAGPALAEGDAHRLRAALDELLECDRVLSALKAPNEA